MAWIVGKKVQRRAVVVLLALTTILNSLVACSTSPAPTAVAAVTPTRTPTQTVTPTVGPTATWTALPTVPAVAYTAIGRGSPTPSATATATNTPTLTATPTATLTPSRTPTHTPTPGPPTPTITPTETITPTPSPTLTPTPGVSPTPLPLANDSDTVEHYLLIGLDSKHNLGAQNTDVIIVAVVNKKTKQVSLLSIPRDLWVYIPTYGWSRINIAHKIGHRTGYPGGGPGLLAETIRMNFGIPIDHWGRIDFQGFKKVVDEVGGVDMVVACPVNLQYRPPDSEDEQEMILEPGVYHMDGETALRYVRTRRNGTDFDRARRQHQFLKEVWYQFRDADLISQIKAVWAGAGESFETDMNLFDVLSLAPLALDLEPQRVRSFYIGPRQVKNWTTHEGWRVLLPRYDRIRQIVASLYAPPATKEEQVAQEGARIRVQNGTYRPQLALIAADVLRWRGLRVVDTGPADRPTYDKTQIIVYNDKPLAVALLTDLLDVPAEEVVYRPDAAQDVDILVILGQDYDPCR